MQEFPKEYTEFMLKAGIDTSSYVGSHSIRRFFRISPNRHAHDPPGQIPTLEELEEEFRDAARKTVRDATPRFPTPNTSVEAKVVVNSNIVDTSTISKTNNEAVQPAPFAEDYVASTQPVLARLDTILRRSLDGSEAIVQTTPIPGIFSLPAAMPLRVAPSYEKGRIYGIDIASVVAVIALLPTQRRVATKPHSAQPLLAHHHLLDLCCAPGGKLAMLAELVEHPLPSRLSLTASSPPQAMEDKTAVDNRIEQKVDLSDLASPQLAGGWNLELGSVTGVDVDLTRLNVAKSLVMKHALRSVRLFCDDACEFDKRPGSAITLAPVKGRRREAQLRWLQSNIVSDALLQLPVWRSGVQIPTHSMVSQDLGGALVLGSKRPRPAAYTGSEKPTEQKESATTVAQRLSRVALEDVPNTSVIRAADSLRFQNVDQVLEFILGVRAPGTVVSGCNCTDTSPLRHVVRYKKILSDHASEYTSHITSRERKLSVEYERRIRKVQIAQHQNGKGQNSDGEDGHTVQESQSVISNDQQTPDVRPTIGEWYDGVLVDAECTHDGSIRHLQKALQSEGDDSTTTKMLDSTRLDGLMYLQRALLSNGFRMLKANGGSDSPALSYSTCSFAVSQNEDIAAWLLATQPCAVSEPIPWHIFGVKAEAILATATADDHYQKHEVKDLEPTDSNTDVFGRLKYKPCVKCPRRVQIASKIVGRLLKSTENVPEDAATEDTEELEILDILKNTRANVTQEIWEGITLYIQRLHNAYNMLSDNGVRFGPEVGTSGLFVCRINKHCSGNV